jgi:hypothetical protein
MIKVNIKFQFSYPHSLEKLKTLLYTSAPVSTGNTLQDLPRLRETSYNTERYL